eukprot:1178836-Prorocentrum_minimum.AAC.6
MDIVCEGNPRAQLLAPPATRIACVAPIMPPTTSSSGISGNFFFLQQTPKEKSVSVGSQGSSKCYGQHQHEKGRDRAECCWASSLQAGNRDRPVVLATAVYFASLKFSRQCYCYT